MPSFNLSVHAGPHKQLAMAAPRANVIPTGLP